MGNCDETHHVLARQGHTITISVFYDGELTAGWMREQEERQAMPPLHSALSLSESERASEPASCDVNASSITQAPASLSADPAQGAKLSLRSLHT